MTKNRRVLTANETKAVLLQTVLRAMEWPKPKPTTKRKPAGKKRGPK